MEPVKPMLRRCAVYTRKSSEEGLEQSFNSLHAQREACEAFIKSQASEGWRLVRTHYDDGGLSGASMERPALQRLLEHIRQGLVEVVVVYKVDRRPPTEAPATKVTPGSVLIREWHGISHRVTVLADGVLLRGARYRSLSEVARKITGTRWSGPRFFGLRAPTKRSDHGTR